MKELSSFEKLISFLAASFIFLMFLIIILVDAAYEKWLDRAHPIQKKEKSIENIHNERAHRK